MRNGMNNEFLQNATADATCAMIEAILHPNSTASVAVIQHVRDIITTVLPVNESISSMDSQRLAQILRPLLGWDKDQPSLLKTLLQNNEMQNRIKEDHPFQDLICGMTKMCKTNRYYFKEDPFDALKCVQVLHSVSDISVDCMFLHLQENPLVCDRRLTQQRRQSNSSRKRKTRSQAQN
jgi:hypothetical protein